MNDIYTNFLDRADVGRAERIEIFDELEEWHLIQGHYCISMAGNLPVVASSDTGRGSSSCSADGGKVASADRETSADAATSTTSSSTSTSTAVSETKDSQQEQMHPIATVGLLGRQGNRPKKALPPPTANTARWTEASGAGTGEKGRLVRRAQPLSLPQQQPQSSTQTQ